MPVIEGTAEDFIYSEAFSKGNSKVDFPLDGLVGLYDFETSVLPGGLLHNKVPGLPAMVRTGDGTRGINKTEPKIGRYSYTIQHDKTYTLGGRLSTHVDLGGFYQNTGDITSIFPTTAQSASLWMKANWGMLLDPDSYMTISTDEQRCSRIMYFAYSAQNTAPNYFVTTGGFSFHFVPGAVVLATVHSVSAPTNRALVYPLVTLSVGWHLFTITRSAEGRCRIYIDGELKAEEANEGAPSVIYYATQRLSIGCDGTPPESYITPSSALAEGIVDNFAVWNRELSIAEVSHLYTSEYFSPHLISDSFFSDAVSYGASWYIEYVEQLLFSDAHQLATITYLQEMFEIAVGQRVEHGGSSQEEHYIYSREACAFLDLSLKYVKLATAVYDTVNVTDASISQQMLLDAIEESLSLAVALGLVEAPTVKETFSVVSQAILNGSIYKSTMSESVKVMSSLLLSWLALAEEGVSLEESTTKARLLSVIEKLTSSGIVSSTLEARAIAAVAFGVYEQMQAGKGAEALSEVQVATGLVSLYKANLALIERTLIETVPAMTVSMRFPLSETLNIDAEISTNAVLNHFITEGISFQFSFNTGDATYTGWVMNTSSFAVSEYDNYPFNSFAKIQGKYYGANDNGLYLLEGEDDAGIPIQARVKLGETNFGRSTKKRLDSVYLGFRADGGMLLKTVTEGNIERWYKVTGDTDKLHRKRVHPLAKGVKAVWWEFTLENIDGADFEVSEIEFVPIMLSRSV